MPYACNKSDILYLHFSRSVRFTLPHSPPPNPHILRYVPKLSELVILHSQYPPFVPLCRLCRVSILRTSILCSLLSYNLALVFTFFPLEPSFFVEISSLVTPFKSAWPLSSVLGNRSLRMGSYGEPDDLSPGGNPLNRLEGTHM